MQLTCLNHINFVILYLKYFIVFQHPIFQADLGRRLTKELLDKSRSPGNTFEVTEDDEGVCTCRIKITIKNITSQDFCEFNVQRKNVEKAQIEIPVNFNF